MIDHHSKAREETRAALAGIERAIRAEPVGEPVFIKNELFRPVFYYPTVFPGLAAAFVIFYPEDTVSGRPVYFVESNPAVVKATRAGNRIAHLLIGEPPPNNGENSTR